MFAVENPQHSEVPRPKKSKLMDSAKNKLTTDNNQTRVVLKLDGEKAKLLSSNAQVEQSQQNNNSKGKN